MSQSDTGIDAENYENYKIEGGPFRKKNKLEHDTICERINEKFPDIAINQHKIQKFLLIFQELVLLSCSDEKFSDPESGIMSLLLTLAKQIQNLLNKDIDSLKFSAVN